MKRVARTVARPPGMVRRPRNVPLSQLIGATPTRAAILRRVSWPSSGSSAIRVRRVTGPTPGTRLSSSASSCQAGVLRIAPSMSPKFGLQEGEMAVDGLDDAALGRRAAAIALGNHHLDDLAAARHQFAKRLRLGLVDRPGRWPHGFGKMSACRGVEPVGLGQLAGGTGDLVDLAGIDHRQRQVRGGDRAGHDRLIAARRFHHDPLRDQRLQSRDEPGHAFAVARDGEGLAARPQMHVEPILRHVDPNKMLHVPSLRMRARLAAPATVRAARTADGAPGSEAGSCTQGGEGLPIRHRHRVYLGTAMNERYKEASSPTDLARYVARAG